MFFLWPRGQKVKVFSKKLEIKFRWTKWNILPFKISEVFVLVVAHQFCSCQLGRADAKAVEASVRCDEQVGVQSND